MTVAVLSAAGGLGGHAVSSTGSDGVVAAVVADGAADLEVQAVEHRLVEPGPRAQVLEQCSDRVQPVGQQGVVPFPAVRLGADQAGVDEHAQVLADGRAADRVPGGEVHHACGVARERAQELASHRVGERGERVHGSIGNQ